MTAGRRTTLAALIVATLAAACTAGGSPGATPSGTTVASPSGAPTSPTAQASPTPTPTPVRTLPALDALPTAAELARAKADVGRLSTRALAGQLVVGGYGGTSPAAAAAAVRRSGVGGLVVFAANVPTDPDAVAPTLRSVAARVAGALAAQNRDWPAFLSVDQEGGPVARIGRPATEFPAAMALGAAMQSGVDSAKPDATLARRVGAASGAELRAIGFTVDLAPVADVTIGPRDPTIGVRSPGSDPEAVAAVAQGLARGYLDAGVLPVPKHFPGHGSLRVDSHLGLPRQKARLASLERRDLLPFQRLVEAGAPALMTGHIVVEAMEAMDNTRPASLSPAVTTGLLREQLGFAGLVVTDGLEMAAVADRYGSGAAAVRAVKAGADVVLLPPSPEAAADALAAAVTDGTFTRDRLVASAARMVAVLRHTAALARPPAASVVGTHDLVARALADASVTQVSGLCRARLVGTAVTVAGAGSIDRSRFAAAARRAGLRVAASGTLVRLLGGGAYNAGSGGASGSQVGRGDVVVALDVPYGLAASRARTARLAAYGRTPRTFDAVVAILLGRQRAQGTLPVAVGAWPRGTGCRDQARPSAPS